MIADAHVHFFSPGFFDALGAQKGWPAEGRVGAVVQALEWESDVSVAALAARWVSELDAHGVSRAALIASLPGDEASVAGAVAAHPDRFVGFFMLDPTRPDALDRIAWAAAHGLRGICLFPAMHRYPLGSPDVARVFDLAAASPGHGRVRPLRGAVGGSAQEARPAQPVRDALRQPARPAGRGARPLARADHHSALRRRDAARGADAGRRLPQRALRHVELERLDALHARD